MEKAKQIIGALILIAIWSCKDNQTCRQEILGDQVWHGEWGSFEDIHFRSDDTLEWKSYSSQTWSTKDVYDFDDDCKGFIWHASPPTNSNFHWLITIVNSDSIHLDREGPSAQIIIHR